MSVVFFIDREVCWKLLDKLLSWFFVSPVAMQHVMYTVGIIHDAIAI